MECGAVVLGQATVTEIRDLNGEVAAEPAEGGDPGNRKRKTKKFGGEGFG